MWLLDLSLDAKRREAVGSVRDTLNVIADGEGGERDYYPRSHRYYNKFVSLYPHITRKTSRKHVTHTVEILKVLSIGFVDSRFTRSNPEQLLRSCIYLTCAHQSSWNSRQKCAIFWLDNYTCTISDLVMFIY